MSILTSGAILLQSGEARCVVAPRAGGAIAEFWTEADGRRLDWLRPASALAIATGALEAMGCVPLTPLAGSMREGRFQFRGSEVSDARFEHDLPAYAWRQSWHVEECA